MSRERGVYAHVTEYPITARIGTRSEFLELADKALEINPTLVSRCTDPNHWQLLGGVKWTDIIPGSTLAYLIEKLEAKYSEHSGSVRIMLTSTDAALFITGSVPSYRYVCSESDLLKFYEQTCPGMIDLPDATRSECRIHMRRAMEAYPDHPIVKEFMQCYAEASLTEASAKANNHVLYFEFI